MFNGELIIVLLSFVFLFGLDYRPFPEDISIFIRTTDALLDFGALDCGGKSSRRRFS
jgi:hypothetical protein